MDVVVEGNKLYAVGETSSELGINTAMNPTFYAQGYHGIPLTQTLDAMIVCFETTSRQPFWTTWFGGERLDRAWGIAIGNEEAFLVGGTWSNQALFPLLEYDDQDPLDWYDGSMQNNFDPVLLWTYYPFAETWTHFHLGPTWGGNITGDIYNDYRFDGDIASFGLDYTVGVIEPTGTHEGSVAVPIVEGSAWNLLLPNEGSWWIEVVDASGRSTNTPSAQSYGGTTYLDLSRHPAGLYLVSAFSNAGRALTCKLIRR